MFVESEGATGKKRNELYFWMEMFGEGFSGKISVLYRMKLDL